MDRTLFRTTAMVGLILSLGATAAEAGGRHGGGGAPMRVFSGMHAGPRPGFGGFHGVPPVSGVIRMQPGAGGGYAGGYGGRGPGAWGGAGNYGGQHFGGAGYGGGYRGPTVQGASGAYGSQVAGGYGRGPAIYSLGRSTGGFGGRGSVDGGGRFGGGQYAGFNGGRGGERFHHGRRFGYGAGALGAAAGLAAGYAVAGGGYAGGYDGGVSYGGGYDAGYAGYDGGAGYAAPVDTGYASGDAPLTVRYGEPALLPSTPDASFGAGGYALDGQVQDAGYGGPHVAGYGYGGTTGWSPGIAPAGGLAVYSPGAYGPGPRVITIPSNYAGASTTHCTCVPATAGY